MSVARLAIESSNGTVVRVDGRDLVLFAGCNYLGLAQEPAVLKALSQGVRDFGISSSASRETTGNTRAHDELENDLARFLGLEAALLAPAGYLSNLFVAQALAPEIGAAVVDRECHVGIRDALAATNVRTERYAFCDAHSAREAARTLGSQRFAVFTDGAFPVMKGVAPLADLLRIVPDDGVLVVDDCHGTGVLGASGRGTHEHHGIRDPRLVVTGTLSKALGCFGGFAAGNRHFIERVRERSHAYIGSTPIPPALARAGSAAVRVLEREPARLQRLRDNIDRLRAALRATGIATHDLPLPVFAWKLDSRAGVERVSHGLVERGLLVPHVDYPDGLGGYFRCAVSAAHTPEQIALLGRALAELSP